MSFFLCYLLYFSSPLAKTDAFDRGQVLKRKKKNKLWKKWLVVVLYLEVNYLSCCEETRDASAPRCHRMKGTLTGILISKRNLPDPNLCPCPFSQFERRKIESDVVCRKVFQTWWAWKFRNPKVVKIKFSSVKEKELWCKCTESFRWNSGINFCLSHPTFFPINGQIEQRKFRVGKQDVQN